MMVVVVVGNSDSAELSADLSARAHVMTPPTLGLFIIICAHISDKFELQSTAIIYSLFHITIDLEILRGAGGGMGWSGGLWEFPMACEYL